MKIVIYAYENTGNVIHRSEDIEVEVPRMGTAASELTIAAKSCMEDAQRKMQNWKAEQAELKRGRR